MSISEKGKKGFQNINKEVKKDKRVVSYLTEKELNQFKEYCKEKGFTPSLLLRDIILDLLSK